MRKTNSQSRRTAANRQKPFAAPKRFLGLVCGAILMTCLAAQAQDADDLYVHVLVLQQQGDAFKTSGDAAAALAKYRAAQTELQAFRSAHSDWNVKVVAYRARLIGEKIADLTPKVTPDTTPAPSGSQSTAAASGETVKLLEAGAEPRSVLRLHPKPGDKQTVLMTIKMAMETQVGENAAPAVNIPPMTITMESTVKSVSPDGDISYDTLITDGSVAEDPGGAPQMAAAMNAALAGIKGLTGTGIMSSRGISKKGEMSAPAGANPQMRQVMDQMKETFATLCAPFPEEAVGTGAKWESRKPIKSQGMTISQTAAYELVSLDGERVVAKSTINQTAANQKVQIPAMPTMKVDLTKMIGKASGELTFDLAQLMPPAGNLDSHAELLMGMNTGGQKTTMTMKMDLNLKLESK